MSFSALAAKAAAVAQSRLGDPGRVLGVGGEVADGVSVVLFLPDERELIGEAGIVRAKPRVEILVSDAPWLTKGATVETHGRVWRVADRPTKSDDGQTWRCDVEPRGPVGDPP